MYCRAFSALLALTVLTACSHREASGPPPRIAVLRFENLSPDPSLDWLGRALSETLIRETGAVPLAVLERAQQPFAPHAIGAPGISSELAAALQAGAGRIVTGYFTGTDGNLAVTAVERDSITQKITQSISATGDLFSVAAALAQKIVPHPQSAGTRNRNAVRQYAIGLETAGAAAAPHFEQAVAADPNFGDCYLAWTRAAAGTQDRPELERALEQGIARGAALGPLDHAYLELESANFRQDRAARLAALAKIAKLTPDDVANIRLLADAEVGAHQFGPAIAHYQQAIALTPANADLFNLLAYARMFANDYTGALTAVHDYQKLKPEDTNTLDSEGDIHFYFGKFADAEKLYQRAFAKEPAFQGGTDGWKAARAHLAAGDVAGATALFRKFEDSRTEAGDASADFRAAEWRYLTGDCARATAAMATAGDTARNPDIRSLAYTQAAIWEVVAGRTADAARHASLAVQLPRPATVANAAIARFLAQPPASAAEWTRRGEEQIKGPGSESVRRLAIAYAHLIAKQYNEAAVEWKEIYAESNPNDQTPAFLYVKAAVAAGRPEEVASILKTNPIPSPVPAASWECLFIGTPAPAK